MSMYAAGLLISIIVYLAVGNYAGRKVKHLEDYFVAGRNAPTLLIVGTLVASLMSTNAFMGETGVGYSGFPAVVIILTAIFGGDAARPRALAVLLLPHALATAVFAPFVFRLAQRVHQATITVPTPGVVGGKSARGSW